MTAKSETVGVVAWGNVLDVMDDDRTAVDEMAATAETEVGIDSWERQLEKHDEARVAVVKLIEALQAAEQKLTTLISGLDALAGEYQSRGVGDDKTIAERIRALVPAAANTESEEGHGTS